MKPLFIECWECGERWKAGDLPMDVDDLVKIKQECPGCGNKSGMSLCPTEGEKAVTEPRRGSHLSFAP